MTGEDIDANKLQFKTYRVNGTNDGDYGKKLFGKGS